MSLHPQKDRRRIADDAARWATRLSEGGVTASEQEAFDSWLTADPRHLEAYEVASRVWSDAALLPGLSTAEFARTVRNVARSNVPVWLRPSVLAGVALACAAVVAVLLARPLWPQGAPQYATEIAEIAPVTLEDGSIVTLGADSAIDTDFSNPASRTVALRSGQAFFEIAHNAERPFYVMAGDVAVRVVGTKFDVRRGPEQTIISVREGVVRVSANDETHTLRAGGSAIIQHERTWFAPRVVATEISTVTPTNVAAWREGRLSYTGTPLSELVADLNRYYAPGVELSSDDLGDLRVTAAFPSGDAEQFVQDLPQIFPVELDRQANGRYVLSPRSESQ